MKKFKNSISIMVYFDIKICSLFKPFESKLLEKNVKGS